MQYQKTTLHKFLDKGTGLSFDLNIGLLGDQIWGYYT